MDILIIEDEPVIGKAVQKGLGEAGHVCTWVKDGVLGREAARSQKHDVIILDLLLPGEPGLTLLEKLRKDYRLARAESLLITASLQQK